MGIVKRILLLLAGLVVVGAALLAWEFGLRRPYTPAIEAAPGTSPVAALETVELNGTRQSILIRGHERSEPMLLFLHGGPGMPAMYLAHAWQRPLERDFVIVHWDRLGAGKSYAAGAGHTPSVRQRLDDLYALTAILRERFDPPRLHLVGHSWGSYLGMIAAHERPELFDAYIGTGQMAAGAGRIAAEREAFFRRAAAARGDDAMLARLDRGDPVTEDDLFAYGAELRGETSFWPILLTGMRAPEYGFSDIMNVPRGAERLGREMRYDVIEGPLDENLLAFDIPVYFLLGRHDWNEPSTLAARYLGRIEAPAKGLVWFEDSAHFPFWEEPARFRTALRAIDARVAARAGEPGA